MNLASARSPRVTNSGSYRLRPPTDRAWREKTSYNAPDFILLASTEAEGIQNALCRGSLTEGLHYAGVGATVS